MADRPDSGQMLTDCMLLIQQDIARIKNAATGKASPLPPPDSQAVCRYADKLLEVIADERAREEAAQRAAAASAKGMTTDELVEHLASVPGVLPVLLRRLSAQPNFAAVMGDLLEREPEVKTPARSTRKRAAE